MATTRAALYAELPLAQALKLARHDLEHADSLMRRAALDLRHTIRTKACARRLLSRAARENQRLIADAEETEKQADSTACKAIAVPENTKPPIKGVVSRMPLGTNPINRHGRNQLAASRHFLTEAPCTSRQVKAIES